MTADPARAVLRTRLALHVAERQRAVLTLAVGPLLLAVLVAGVCWWRVL